MKPTIGRIVHYYGPGFSGELAQDGPHAAIITNVWTDRCVNLRVFYQDGSAHEVTSVEASDEARADCWTWPPRT